MTPRAVRTWTKVAQNRDRAQCIEWRGHGYAFRPYSPRFSKGLPSHVPATMSRSYPSRQTKWNQWSQSLRMSPTVARPALVLVAFVWGSYPVLCRYLYTATNSWALHPITFNTLRLTLAAMLCMPSFLRARSRSSREDIVAGFELGLYTCLVNLCQVCALKYSLSARVAFLAQFQTVLVPVVELLPGWRSDSPSARTRSPYAVILAAAAAVVGMALMTLKVGSGSGGGSHNLVAAVWRGDVLAIASAVFAAAYILRSRARATSASDVGMVASVRVLSHAAFAIAHSAFNAIRNHSIPTPSLRLSTVMSSFTPLAVALNAVLLLYASGVSGILCARVQMAAQVHVPASSAAMIFALLPVATTILSALLLGERLTSISLVGALLIATSSLLGSRLIPRQTDK